MSETHTKKRVTWISISVYFVSAEHSDFVCLDTMAEEADSAGPLYGSTHSSNGSSLSSSFSFVTCHYPYPHDQAREKFARRLKAAAARRYSDHDDGEECSLLFMFFMSTLTPDMKKLFSSAVSVKLISLPDSLIAVLCSSSCCD